MTPHRDKISHPTGSPTATGTTVLDTTTLYAKAHHFILEELLPGTSPEELQPTTPLITSGILDSLSILRFRTYLEEELGVEIAGHELDFDNFGTLQAVVDLLERRLAP